METENKNARKIMDSTMGEKLEALLGIGTKKFNRTDEKKVPLGKSYTKPVDEE